MSAGKNETVALRPRTGWRSALSVLRAEPDHSRILSGSLVMLIGSGLVSIVNFAYNIAVARLLGPSGFGHAAAAVTLLMLGSAITLAFQLVCAKLVARAETPGAQAAVFSLLRRRAWIVGVLLGSSLTLLSAGIAHYLRLPSPSLVMLLGAGLAFYVPLGVKRGGLQGLCAFKRLAVNFLLEVLVKFLGAIVLIEAGYGVLGAVGAISASVILAYFLPANPRQLEIRSERGPAASFREGVQAIVFFVGQVVINNVDILLVKHFFSSEIAGLYAGIALVGRVVYMSSWSVVSAMFPISAGSKREDGSASVLVVPLTFVLAIALAFTWGLGQFPNLALRTVFGAGFQAATPGLDGLLMLYAAATGVYSLSVVLMAYEMSRKLANSGYIQLLFSGAIILGIQLFHADLRQVIVVQLVLMVLLLISVSVPFFFRGRPLSIAGAETVADLSTTSGQATLTSFGPVMLAQGYQELKAAKREPRAGSQEPILQLPIDNSQPAAGVVRVRRISEAEMIAQFLRNEFHHAEFDSDRERFQSVVMNADTGSEGENALRRALLFRRRGNMLRELPSDTQWWEIKISDDVVRNLRVFPRAQWRKLASGSFLLSDVVQRIANNHFAGRTGAFLRRIKRFSEHLRTRTDQTCVLLIGIDERQPFTILEGNHRVTAAMLVSPSLVRQRFRFYCGFSPHMTECCWYQTNFATLYRYARNRLKILMYDREADITRLVSTLYHSPGSDENEDRIGDVTVTAVSDIEAQRREAS